MSALEIDHQWWSANQESQHKKLRGSPREGRPAFIALTTFTVILLLAPQYWIPGLAPFRIALMAGGGALAFVCWDRFVLRRDLIITLEMVLCLAIAVWATVTLPLSRWPGGSINVLTDSYLKAVIIFLLLSIVIATEERLRLIALTLVLCTAPLSISAVKNYLAGNFIAGGVGRRVVGYQSALGANPNDLALMLNLIIPIGIAIFLSSRSVALKILCLAIIGCDVLAIILTYSRAGFLGFMTIGALYFIKLVRRSGDRRWALTVLFLAFLSLPLLPSGYVNRIATITDVEADETGSAQQRWQGNVAATQFILHHPIVGAGIGMSILALNETGGPLWHEVHNVYLEYAVDLGLPGFILFVALFYLVFKAARASRRKAEAQPALRDLFLLDEGLEVSLTVFFVAGAFHPVAYHFYFYYITGLALAARTATDNAIRSLKDAGEAQPEPISDEQQPWFVRSELA